MTHERDKSKRTPRFLARIAVVAAALAAAMAAPTQAAPPAVDEYTLDLPGAGGPKHPDRPSEPKPEALVPETRDALSAPEDEALVAIATDPELGALKRVAAKPEPYRGGGRPLGGESRGFVAAAAGAVNDARMLALLGALGLIALVALVAARGRRSGPAG